MSDLSDDEPVYEVERLLAEDTVEGQVFYLVKWLNYDDEQCTWEPLESFNSDTTIREWEKAKRDGDVLDDEFLTALQLRMDRFQGRQPLSEIEKDDSDYVTEEDENTVVVHSPKSLSSRQIPDTVPDNESDSLSVRIKESGSPVPKKRKLFHQTLGEPSIRAASADPVPDAPPAAKTPLPISRLKDKVQSNTTKNHAPNSDRTEAPNGRKLSKAIVPRVVPEKANQKKSLNIKGPVMPSINRVGLSSRTKPFPTSLPKTQLTTTKGTPRIDRSEELRPLAGQRFRNLKHQNNARKRLRNERAPDPSTLKLVTATELDLTTAEDTAHVLPVDTTRVAESASLFIPELEDDTSMHTALDLVNQLSNVRDVGPSEARPTASRQGETLSRQPSNTGRREAKTLPIRVEASPIVSATASKQRTFETASQTDPMPRHSNQGFPPTAEIMRAANGLEWYKGDIVVELSLGRPIGIVKLVGAPWFPIGNQIVSLKVGTSLKIDFPPQSIFSRFEYDQSQPHHNGAIWSVEPFPRTVQAVDEFSDYLEQNDIAGLWHHPTENLSMLLYSYEAPSWRDIGWRPARIGRPRLHVAFLRNLDRGVNKPPSLSIAIPTVSQPVSATAANDVSIGTRTQTRESESAIEAVGRPLARRNLSHDGSHSESPRSRRNSGYSSRDKRPSVVASPADIPSHTGSPFEYQSTPTSPRTPLLHTRSAMSIRRDTNYDLRLQALRANLTVPDLSIDFKCLTDRSISNSRIDKKRAFFFIAFSKTHEHEAVLLHRWLEAHTTPSHIFTDSDQDGWNRLKRRAEADQMTVILFHAESPDYGKYEGLGTMLSMEHVQCHSLTFGPYSATAVTPVTMSPLFPRGSVFLVSESNITHSIDHAIFILRYFLKEKRPGWKIMFRPRIRTFLRDAAAKERTPINRVKLLDLLVLIQGMMFAADLEPYSRIDNDDEKAESLRGGEDGAEDQVKAYVISPSSLPGYDDTGQDAESLKKRDAILLEYFCGWSADRAHRYRRFWAFGKGLVASDSGHVHFEDPDRFVDKNAAKVTRKSAK